MTSGSSSQRYRIDPGITILRNVQPGNYAFKKIFRGFEKLRTIRDVFGERTEQVLSDLKVEVFPREGYMGVSDEDGHIFASMVYLNEGEAKWIYLDAVHELVHVRQFFERKNLFDPAFVYVDRPTEIEAYRITVEEARRIGFSEHEIFEYLQVPWITKAQHEQLAIACGVVLEPREKQKSEE